MRAQCRPYILDWIADIIARLRPQPDISDRRVLPRGIQQTHVNPTSLVSAVCAPCIVVLDEVFAIIARIQCKILIIDRNDPLSSDLRETETGTGHQREREQDRKGKKCSVHRCPP